MVVVLLIHISRNFQKRLCEILGSEEESHYIYIKVYAETEVETAVVNTPLQIFF